jgi:hypothetical protein
MLLRILFAFYCGLFLADLGFSHEINPPPMTCPEPELDPNCKVPNPILPWEVSDNQARRWSKMRCEQFHGLAEGVECYELPGDKFQFSADGKSHIFTLDQMKQALKAERRYDDDFKALEMRSRSGERSAEDIKNEIRHYKLMGVVLKAAGPAAGALTPYLIMKLSSLAIVPQAFIVGATVLAIAYTGYRLHLMLEEHLDELEKELERVEGGRPSKHDNSLPGGGVGELVGDSGASVEDHGDGSLTITVPDGGGGKCSSSTGYKCPTGVMSECHLKVTINCNH